MPSRPRLQREAPGHHHNLFGAGGNGHAMQFFAAGIVHELDDIAVRRALFGMG